ncbi:HTH domain-containing protein [Corynebacterium appendicis CIP 107643]|uniref:HTH domain-containing protein n=1 Tax=Corynebacterium appendicis CIP 107643 TaxID=1161099 RepID=A0A1N7J800_9CORY|nr:HTH domain-containing protein [Corynebacterium appendicis]MCT1684031.1 HTH domain-containing protein [Corynebacterium appendicis]WJY61935.1 HTH domain protein [Corynebacterium appendicis CIP 107643]SIS45493.1 HTH domain-containing protein [Corynebacterium appendicis CIP 107643]
MYDQLIPDLPPHPAEAAIEETEKYQRKEKVAHFLRGAELIRLLQIGRPLEGRVLAERIGVDKRTLRRYIAHLRELGFNITSKPGADGGYTMEYCDTVPPLTFTDDELEVLMLALSSTGYPGDELMERAGQLTQRIRRLLPPHKSAELSSAGNRRYFQLMQFWGAYNREKKAEEAKRAEGTGD